MNPWVPLLLLIATVGVVVLGMMRRWEVNQFIIAPLMFAGGLFSFALMLTIVAPFFEESAQFTFDAGHRTISISPGLRLAAIAVGMASGGGGLLLLLAVVRWLRLLSVPRRSGEHETDDYSIRLKQ
jgi:hypothetical protein